MDREAEGFILISSLIIIVIQTNLNHLKNIFFCEITCKSEIFIHIDSLKHGKPDDKLFLP